MGVLTSKIAPEADAFRENQAAHAAQMDLIRAASDLSLAGGGDAARARHDRGHRPGCRA